MTKLMQISMFIIFTFLLLFAFQAKGLSCQSTTDRVFAECSGGSCSSLIYIREITGFSGCSRRPVIESPPNWALDVIEFEISNRSKNSETGTFELALSSNVWSDSYMFSNLDEYKEASEVFKKRNASIATLNYHPDMSISQVGIAWKARAADAYQIFLLKKISDWMGLIIAFAGLFLSILWFTKWQKGTVPISLMLFGVLFQAGILGFGITSSMTFFSYSVSILALFIPGIRLYQIISLAIEYKLKNQN